LIARTHAKAKKRRIAIGPHLFSSASGKHSGEGQECEGAALLHQDLGLIFRVIRDVHAYNLKRIVIDDRLIHTRVQEFLKEYLPEERCEVEYFDEKEDIFEFYRIEMDIAKLTNRKVWLKSGGYIVFDIRKPLR